MPRPKQAVVASENELITVLNEKLKGEISDDDGVSVIADGNADVVIIDLRAAERWEKVESVWKQATSNGSRPTPVLGIVGDGVPPEWCPRADRFLAGLIPWPVDENDLRDRITNAQQAAKQKIKNATAEFRVLETASVRFTTYTPSLFHVFDDLVRAAERDFSVLLIGETGTGKTTMAKIIHDLSNRRGSRFITVPCGALPSELVGSELFGHVRGAFTGADRDKQGKFEAASGGTLLLDEIDVLGLEQQANLLRVLESGEYEAVGSNETLNSDTRIIAAANQNLESAISAGTFRSDLFFRLNQVKFEMPPLRERPLDIIPLATQVIEECAREDNVVVTAVEPEVLEILRRADWPGNIRQLRNEVRRGALFNYNGVMKVESLSPELIAEAKKKPQSTSRVRSSSQHLADEVALTECELIETMLRRQNFNRAATARALGISRVTLYNRIRKYNIKVEP